MTTSNIAPFMAWESLASLFESMVSNSQRNMEDAGRVLVVAAGVYVQLDESTMRYLLEHEDYLDHLEELGLGQAKIPTTLKG